MEGGEGEGQRFEECRGGGGMREREGGGRKGEQEGARKREKGSHSVNNSDIHKTKQN